MRPLFLGIGVIALLVGLVWTLQGANVLMGSVVPRNSFWLPVSVALVIAGFGLVGLSA